MVYCPPRLNFKNIPHIYLHEHADLSGSKFHLPFSAAKLTALLVVNIPEFSRQIVHTRGEVRLRYGDPGRLLYRPSLRTQLIVWKFS